MLLRFTIDYYQLQHPEWKALDAISHEVGLTTQTLQNYLAGKGQPGVLHWVRLYSVTGCDLIARWINLHLNGIRV